MKSFFINDREELKHYICVVAGTLLMSVAVVVYFDTTGVVPGGVTGVAIILKELWGVPMWLVNAIINIPLFIMGYKILERDIFVKTLFGTISLTTLLGIVKPLDILTGNLLVDIITGSVVMGTGLGLIFASYASSGGTDLAATLINRRIPYVSIPKIMALIDGLIVIAGAFVFGIEKGIYAIIAIYIVAKVSDSIMEGPNRAKLIYIISDRYDEVARYILEIAGRGVTYIESKGAYTGKSKNMIMCVVPDKEMVKIRQNLYKIDKNAFCFVGDIREAFGEGFTKFRG